MSILLNFQQIIRSKNYDYNRLREETYNSEGLRNEAMKSSFILQDKLDNLSKENAMLSVTCAEVSLMTINKN